jgi:acyl-coenzyme A synthetase/AMP-(fatty) acid ligase
VWSANAFGAAGVVYDQRRLTFGLVKIGAVHVAVDWRLAPVEMQQIIEDSQAQVVLVGRGAVRGDRGRRKGPHALLGGHRPPHLTTPRDP